MKRMTDSEFEIRVLAFLEERGSKGADLHEIASHLDMTYETIRKRLHRMTGNRISRLPMARPKGAWKRGWVYFVDQKAYEGRSIFG